MHTAGSLIKNHSFRAGWLRNVVTIILRFISTAKTESFTSAPETESIVEVDLLFLVLYVSSMRPILDRLIPLCTCCPSESDLDTWNPTTALITSNILGKWTGIKKAIMVVHDVHILNVFKQTTKGILSCGCQLICNNELSHAFSMLAIFWSKAGHFII